ncbi:MAG: hypothetical protein ACKPH7_14230 [Planktothrix sp.]|uniref:hypothetical protein n=1 Tax=Planktothrix sp. TaxID=3088171 RepID=UPI0038D3F86A
MPFIITPPSASFDGNVTQKTLGTIETKETTLTANTAADVLLTDATATLGRKILSISNNGSEPVYLNYGSTATTSNYDFILYGNRQLLEIEYNGEKISAIAAAAATIKIKFAKYVEI